MRRRLEAALLAVALMVFGGVAWADTLSTIGEFAQFAPNDLEGLGFTGIDPTELNSDEDGNINLGSFAFPDIAQDYQGLFYLTINLQLAAFAVEASVKGSADTNGINDIFDVTFKTDGPQSLAVDDVHFFRTGRNQTRSVPLTGHFADGELTLRVSSFAPAPIPEPASLTMFFTTLGGLALICKKKLAGK